MRCLLKAFVVTVTFVMVVGDLAHAFQGNWLKYRGDVCNSGAFPALGTNGKFGFIDKSGNWLIPPQFEDVGCFNSPYWEFGLAPAKSGGKWGYINGSGKVVIPAAYDDAEEFTPLAGEDYIPVLAWDAPGRAPVRVGDSWFYIDGKGQRLPDDLGPLSAAGMFIHGFSRARRAGGQWGFVGRDLTWSIPPQFANVGDFYQGLAAAQQDANGKWGFVGQDGKWVIHPQFDAAGGFRWFRANVRIGELWGFVGQDGNWAVRPQYASCQPFGGTPMQSLAAVKPTSGGSFVGAHWSYIDGAGKTVVPVSFWFAKPFYGGLAGVSYLAQAGGKTVTYMGYIDISGALVIKDIDAPEGVFPGEFHNGLALSGNDDFVNGKMVGHWMYINKSGHRVYSGAVGDAK